MNYDVVIVGTGFSARRMAIKLKRAGFADFAVLPETGRCTFDAAASRWTIDTASSAVLTARVIVAEQSTMDIIGRAGLSLQEALRNRVTAYPGTAVPGFPNLFLLLSPKSARYVVACLRMMGRTDSKAMEVQPHAREPRRPKPHHFSLTPFEDDLDETHRSPAVVTANGQEIPVEVHLTGHIQPIDGSFRWYGRIAKHPEVTALHETGRKEVTLQLPGSPARKAQLTEVDPWGNVRVTGSGQPPFPIG
jgi:hypothetical protein